MSSRRPGVVLEGDYLVPELQAAFGDAVRAVVLDEPDVERLVDNYRAREPGNGEQRYRAQVTPRSAHSWPSGPHDAGFRSSLRDRGPTASIGWTGHCAPDQVDRHPLPTRQLPGGGPVIETAPTRRCKPLPQRIIRRSATGARCCW